MKSILFRSILLIAVIMLTLLSCSWDEERRLAKTYIVITFDDQHSSIYDIALPIMQQHGFKATNAINTNRIGRTGNLTWQQVEELEFSMGWETAGHTLNHANLPDCDDDEALYEIEQDWLNLKERGLSHDTFVLPRGHATERDYQIIKRFYKNIRNSIDSRMRYPIDRWHIGYFPYLTHFTAQDAITRISEGILNKEALIVIGFHRFNDPEHTHSCAEEDFIQIMHFIKDQGLTLITLKEAAELLR
ncbi:MAG: polysaccharide deacetylase family protein [Candidatus Cloacimonetes bacterium]|nr:polysaccharide deacetylase family protein [Candidatus Cloacimonadota bacterium]